MDEDGGVLLSGTLPYTLVQEIPVRAGIYAAPTEQLLGLGKRPGTVSGSGYVTWEAGHAVRMALNAHPAVVQLLWLPYFDDDSYLGWELVHLRSFLVSAQMVRQSFVGAAHHAFQRAMRMRWQAGKMDSSTQSGENAEMRSHVTRAARLLLAATELWETGRLSGQVQEFMVRGAADSFEDGGANSLIGDMFRVAETEMSRTPNLATVPDRDAAEQWLLNTRREYWKEKHDTEAQGQAQAVLPQVTLP